MLSQFNYVLNDYMEHRLSLKFSFKNGCVPNGWSFHKKSLSDVSFLKDNLLVSFCCQHSMFWIKNMQNKVEVKLFFKGGSISRERFVLDRLHESVSVLEIGDMMWYVWTGLCDDWFGKISHCWMEAVVFANNEHRKRIIQISLDALDDLAFPLDVAGVVGEYVTGDFE